MEDRKPDVNDLGDDPGLTKADLRREMRRRRLVLPDRAERSDAIWMQVRSVPEVVAARRLLVFSSIPGEPEVAPLVEWAATTGKQVAVPEDDVEPDWPDVVIVPGLAFTAAGHRLGQGGGWSDRFLADVRPDCLTIGVGFADQLLDAVPTEAHDVRLDLVITEPASGTS
jgi:5-formyltetrahydrofolate cyclo-ligase